MTNMLPLSLLHLSLFSSLPFLHSSFLHAYTHLYFIYSPTPYYPSLSLLPSLFPPHLSYPLYTSNICLTLYFSPPRSPHTQLAQSLAPIEVPDICIQYGQQMEFRGEYEQALKLFESALTEQDEKGRILCPPDHAVTANTGVARCNLRLGNIRQVRSETISQSVIGFERISTTHTIFSSFYIFYTVLNNQK